jgi:hypothetical protein
MPQLIPLYARIDDATLEAMASKGIVRRARADAVNVRFESTGADEIVGTIEGATVRFDDKGLAKARCSCPAATVCRHKIAVVLALRTQAGEQQATPTVEIDWPTRLSTFDRKTLQNAAGKPACARRYGSWPWRKQQLSKPAHSRSKWCCG